MLRWLSARAKSVRTARRGNEKGAFTGAVGRREGYLKKADGGTLFLDEIGDLPHALQSKLLRAIQEKRFQRVGSAAPMEVDVRFVSATNKDVEKMVQGGELTGPPHTPFLDVVFTTIYYKCLRPPKCCANKKPLYQGVFLHRSERIYGLVPNYGFSVQNRDLVENREISKIFV